ncbi:hypothetical protein Tco_0194806 [Tanacetum coccineum]
MTDEKTPTNFALMAFSDSEEQNNKTCTKTCLKSFEDLKSQYDNLRIKLNKSEFDLANYKRGLAYVEEQLVFYKKNEGMLCDKVDVLKIDSSFNESEINALKIQIERFKKEKESNQIKMDNFENASKSLDKLIGCQIYDNNKKGMRYNVVPPPPTGLFATPTIDLSNSGLEEFKQPEFEGYRVKVNKSVSENSSNEIKRNFAPTIVLTKSGLVPISTTRQSSSRAAASVSTVRPIKTAAPKSFVNSVNTTKGKRVTSTVGEQGINAVKSKACWVWRPKIKVGDEAVHKELGDRIEKAATTASSFKTEQDSSGPSTAEEFLSTDEEIAQKLNKEEMTKAAASEGLRKYWKIIRVRDVIVAYQSFEDMLKGFDKKTVAIIMEPSLKKGLEAAEA